MKKAGILVALITVLFFTACQDKSVAQEIHLVSPQEFQEAIISKKVQLVDVRTPSEFEAGHFENAININIAETYFITEVEKLNLETPIFIYCQSGKRSAKAALILKDVGFKEIYDLKGGYQSRIQE
ncbi:rhodanese-like domain-containing protein [Aequorivita sp. Q41]|uniref:rhodanese-like domain-containing protein n=1 Tax=Aequorivita sp. Q41 TaxID=3153300 RepID=UPI0032423641